MNLEFYLKNVFICFKFMIKFIRGVIIYGYEGIFCYLIRNIFLKLIESLYVCLS